MPQRTSAHHLTDAAAIPAAAAPKGRVEGVAKGGGSRSPRGLELPSAQSEFGSLEEHVAARRVRLPGALAWLFLIFFCSWYIVGASGWCRLWIDALLLDVW